ncbi:hypothetical protein PU02_0668 [Bartonella ancashensis]|uniref:Uncharacterized protein n=1 Tax=Bartonella ancashensis TaxID=1318743 RepID=A0A0M4LGD6_9HYPH|nr:hypothetical protein PU02_0668 [Bartonella ancashensis]
MILLYNTHAASGHHVFKISVCELRQFLSKEEACNRSKKDIFFNLSS